MADATTPDPNDQAPTQEPQATDEKLGDPGLNALRSEREARKTAEKQLRDATAKLAAFEDANKTEAQRLTDNASKAEQRAQQAEQRLTDALTRQAVMNAAIEAGTIDAETTTLLALAGGAVTLDDNGEVIGAKKAIDALTKSKPHLFRPAGAGTRDATASGTQASTQSMDDWLRGIN
ncbi:phage scaffolding protein [Tessaracoccus palaemonis]|uniref:Phage scaffolding protein n=1 Tax=Tessaracoccus palaemonis TaxID=2829499 RepID=A0ABX8SKS1_9ACTN|nr:phage scaffolding protein [Tessaracoccus palaemonis]QXT62748.1 phage scaffolding protein [Tessaracoccus palaemonis]